MAFKILVSSSFPEELNRNLIVRNSMVDAFRELLGDDNVLSGTYRQLVRQITHYRPDFVLAIGSCVPSVCDYRDLSIACRKVGARLGFWMVDDPYEFDFHMKVVSVADYIFTNDSWAREFYSHDNVHHLPLGAAPKTHWRPLAPATKRGWDLFFCGASFPNREICLRDLTPILKRYRSGIFGADWKIKESFVKNERIPNDTLSDYYSSSYLVINMGRSLNLANQIYQLNPSTPGPRTFEAAMAGCVQLFYLESLEIEEYFEVGTEILTFDGPAQFEALVERYFSDPVAWATMAEAAQKRALADHTYLNRAKKILSVIGAELPVSVLA